MRIPSGSTDRYIYFVAVDSTDLKSREQTLTTFTVYGSLNGAAASLWTTPTVNETDTTNMPGVYELLLDEQTTLTAGNDTEELCLHITQAAMAPVTRTVEIYRPETTEGNTLDVTATGAAGVDWGNVENKTTSNDFTGTNIATTQKVDVETIKTNAVVNGGTITFPTTATLASTTNITAGTIATVTNLTNAPTNGDLTATMKTSVTTACTASTPTAAAVSAAVTIDAASVNLILDETLTGHVTADSVAVAIKDTLADTNELQSDDIPGAITALNDIAAGDVWAVDATTQQTQGTFGQAIGDPVADTTTIYQSVATDATGDNIAVDIVAVKAETVLILADTADIQPNYATTTELNKVPKSDGSTTWNATALVSINDQVVDGLVTDTYGEPAKGAPGATISLKDKIGFLYKAWRNKATQTSTTYSLFNDDASTVDHDSTVSDSGGTATRGEMTDGP